jgi:hypothetical protein
MAALTPEQYEEVLKLVKENSATLSKDQREEIEQLIEREGHNRLTFAQKWDVAMVFAKIVLALSSSLSLYLEPQGILLFKAKHRKQQL